MSDRAARRPGPSARVVFDLDGTLVDSRDDIVGAVRHALAVHREPDRTPDEVAAAVGDGARVLFGRLLGLPGEHPRVDELLATFLPYYAAHAADRTSLMPGAAEALAALGPSRSALCTNKPRAATLTVLTSLALTERFAVVVAAGDLPRNKPHPDGLLHIAARMGVAPGDLVMVGDGVQDVECGRAVGAFTVAVLGGFVDEARLRAARPDVVLATLGELPRLLAADAHATRA